MHARPRFLLALLLAASAIAVGFPQLRAQEAQPIPGPRAPTPRTASPASRRSSARASSSPAATPEDVARGSAYFFMPRAEQDQVKWTIDRDAKLARASFGAITREARFYGDQGCIIQNPGEARHPLHAGRR